MFEIAKTAHGYASTPTTLVSFNGTNGAQPVRQLDRRRQRRPVRHDTRRGGANSDGTVFEIAKTAHGYASTPTTLVSFNGTERCRSVRQPDRRRQRRPVRHDIEGGANGDGTVFEITGSGFSTHKPTTTIIRGNSDNISVFADNTSRYTIIIGNGSNDLVSADCSSHDKITLGNGAGDTVNANS